MFGKKKAESPLNDNPTQTLVCVDASGGQTGRIVDRKTAHTAPGIKHLAIQILVFDSTGDVVLHERPMKKVGGGVLDAPTTHVLSGETFQDAGLRCLRNEYGITEKVDIKMVGAFSYEQDYGDGSCENEFLLAAFTVYLGKMAPSAVEAPRIVRMIGRELVQELVSRPENFPVWLKSTVGLVKMDVEAAKFFA